jgi:hypothetical protein
MPPEERPSSFVSGSMKICSYCGQQNDEALAACPGCGTQFDILEAPPALSTPSRRAVIILALVGLAAAAIVLAIMPYLIIIVPLLAFFYAPIYVPFLISFAIKGPEWRGMRWSLRVASVAAFFIRLAGVSRSPGFGNDAPGNIAGASYNFEWTWGPGLGCGLVAVIVGLLLRGICRRDPALDGPRKTQRTGVV